MFKRFSMFGIIFGLIGFLPALGIVDAGGGGPTDLPTGDRKQQLLEKGKGIVKEAWEFTLIGLGVLSLGLLAGFGAGYGKKKGEQFATRGTVTGTTEDETMTTAQAGARGGRQRAA